MTFRDVSRILTRAQLQKAPSSLLAKLTQTERDPGEGKQEQHLAVPSEAAEATTAGWLEGETDLFQASLAGCIYLYIGLAINTTSELCFGPPEHNSGSRDTLQSEPDHFLAHATKRCAWTA